MPRRSKTIVKKKTLKKEVPKKFQQQEEDGKHTPVDASLSVPDASPKDEMSEDECEMDNSSKVVVGIKVSQHKNKKKQALSTFSVAVKASGKKKRKGVKDEEEEEDEHIEVNPAKEEEEQDDTRVDGRRTRRHAAKAAKYTEVDSTTDEESEEENDDDDVDNDDDDDDDDFECTIEKAKKFGLKKANNISNKTSPQAMTASKKYSKKDTPSSNSKKNTNKTALTNNKESISDIWKPSQGDWRSLAGIDY
jgi:hypothetical protein